MCPGKFYLGADNPTGIALCSIISSPFPHPSPAEHCWRGEGQRRGDDGPALGQDVIFTWRKGVHLFYIPCAKDLVLFGQETVSKVSNRGTGGKYPVASWAEAQPSLS